MTGKQAKTDELSGKEGAKVEYIKPFYQNDHNVLKTIDKQGHAWYYGDNDLRKVLEAYNSDLETELHNLIEPIQVVEIALRTCEHYAFADALMDIRQKAANTIREMFLFIYKNIGEITITGVLDSDPSSRHRYGQCVDAKLSSPNIYNSGKEGPIYDHDPELIEALKQIPPDKTETIKDALRFIRHGKNIQFHVVRD